MPADTSTVEHVLDILCEAFDLDKAAAGPIFYEDPLFDLSHKWLLFEGERPVSTLTLSPSPFEMGGWVLPCAGVAGVATPPGLRGRGHASRLLAEVLRALPAMGYAAAALVPATLGLYRRVGFEFASELWSARFRVGGGGAARPAEERDRSRIRELHRLHGAHRLGAVVRDERRWRYFFLNNPQILRAGEEQYAVVRRTPEETIVRELLPPGPRPEVLGAIAGEVEVSGWREDVAAWEETEGVETLRPPERHDLFMLRVVDVEAVLRALAARHPAEGGVLAVDDPLLAANRGPWEFGDGAVRRATGDVETIPVRSFSAALMRGWDGIVGPSCDLVRLLPEKRVFSLFPCDMF